MTKVLPQARFQLIYRGVDISGDLDPMTTSINYVDHLHGQSDEIDITVQDADGRWKGSWRPEHGDTMLLIITDAAGFILPCGTFEMDEPNASGDRGGDLMTIRGLAAPVTHALRTKKTEAFEQQSLRAIVQKKTDALGMRLEGQINDLYFTRLTQRRERDLEFVKRLAEETGHYCNVRGDTIIFTSFVSVDGQSPVRSVYHGDRKLLSYDFRFQSHETYSKGKASYLDQTRKKIIDHEDTDPLVTNGDTLRISGERMESPAHAQARMKSELHFANRQRFNGSVSTIGDTRLVAGNTITLANFGGYSGKRVIDSSSHRLERGGYTTTAELVDARA